ncbi:MAG: RrF2 family transcriptional regulator [Rhodospirillales bacterium]
MTSGLSKKTLYAIEAVLDVAYHAGGAPVQSRDITRRQGIPRRYLEQALQQLVRAGVLVGVRGPKGGYRLARERRRITAGDIARAVGAGETFGEALDGVCASPLGETVVRPMWSQASERLMAALDETSIDELCERARQSGIESEGRSSLDFAI